jgi:hypothetical protein
MKALVRFHCACKSFRLQIWSDSCPWRP